MCLHMHTNTWNGVCVFVHAKSTSYTQVRVRCVWWQNRVCSVFACMRLEITSNPRIMQFSLMQILAYACVSGGSLISWVISTTVPLTQILQSVVFSRNQSVHKLGNSTVQQDSSDLSSETKRGLWLNIFINPTFHSFKARICVAECTKAPLF